MKNINIVIVESSDILYEGISTILYNSDEKYYISRAVNMEEIETISSEKKIDIIFINPILLLNNDKELRKIKRNYPDVLIAGINTSVIDKRTFAMYDLFFNIYDNSQHILSSIQKHLNQKQDTDTSLTDNEALSDRETEVLLQLIEGLTNKEIADVLNISVHTVISHRKNIMVKTGVRSQAGLALYAISKSLISLDDFEL